MNFIIRFLLLALLINLSLNAKESMQKVSLQFQWKDQFQFAGYYVAKEKGYYKDKNLDVDFLPYQTGDNIVNKVLSNEATYATGRTSLVVERSNGKKVIALAAILQSSPLALAVKKSSNINTVGDFKDKRLSITSVESEASIYAMLLSQKIKISDIINIPSSNKIYDLIKDNTDIISLYTSNQTFALKQKGVEINIFHPKDYGFNFYNDILFTSEEELNNHKQRAIDFTSASLKGWKYAFDNIDKTVELILKKYNTQNKTKQALIYEANVLKKLAYHNNSSLGQIDKAKIQRIYDIYYLMGLAKLDINIDKFIFKSKSKKIELTIKEQKYLEKHNTITIHNEQNWPP